MSAHSNRREPRSGGRPQALHLFSVLAAVLPLTYVAFTSLFQRLESGGSDGTIIVVFLVPMLMGWWALYLVIALLAVTTASARNDDVRGSLRQVAGLSLIPAALMLFGLPISPFATLGPETSVVTESAVRTALNVLALLVMTLCGIQMVRLIARIRASQTH